MQDGCCYPFQKLWSKLKWTIAQSRWTNSANDHVHMTSALACKSLVAERMPVSSSLQISLICRWMPAAELSSLCATSRKLCVARECAGLGWTGIVQAERPACDISSKQ